MIEIDGKQYKLVEVWVIDEYVEQNYPDWGQEITHTIDVAKKEIEVKKVWALEEVE